jgi:hypothetical protein
MTRQTAIRWWPPAGLLAMVLLGLLVGKGSTPVDDWFIRTADTHTDLRRLLLFTSPKLVALTFFLAVTFALYRRRWRLAAIVVVTPAIALAVERISKPLFGRQRDGALAYPSGHVTLTVVVTGMVVLVAGGALWAIVAAIAVSALGLFGQAFTYHYFSDTIGAAFLGTAMVCLAATAAGLDRCQPRCDPRHSGG